MERILDIDFTLFSYDNPRKLYSDYLWSISRPYIKYLESTMYLIFECGSIETYESFASDSDGNEVVPVTKIDRDETLKSNMAYYYEMYGNDYFFDESEIEDDIIDVFDEDEAEFEWTMLEMNLAKENIEDDEYYDDFDESGEHNIDMDDEFVEISGMNPEEMLKYIRRE